MKKPSNWRINTILIIAIILGAAIASRLFFLQILDRKHLKAEALGQQVDFNSVTGPRGQIFCEDSQNTKGGSGSGELKSFAINKDDWIITANPSQIADKQNFADILSKNINQTKDQILTELSSSDSYAIIEKDSPPQEITKIKTLNLKGLSWQNIPDRYYPQGTMGL